jgi:gliding motility-associated-like protein
MIFRNALRRLWFTIFILVGILPVSKSADYYWVGGSGDWFIISNWATVSGGTIPPLGLPDSTDNIFFDSLSFSGTSQTVTINGTFRCKNLFFSGVQNRSPRLSGGNLSVYGSVKLDSMVSLTTTLRFVGSDTGRFIQTNGGVFGDITVDLSSSTLRLSDGLQCRDFYFENGNFSSNSFPMLAHNIQTRNHRLSSFLILDHSDIQVKQLKFDFHIFLNLSLNDSRIEIEDGGGIYSCISLNFKVLKIRGSAILDDYTPSGCGTMGGIQLSVDSLVIDKFGSFRLMNRDSGFSGFTATFIGIDTGGTLRTDRRIQSNQTISYGNIEIVSHAMEVDELEVYSPGNVLLAPLSGFSSRLTVRNRWFTEGDCLHRIKIKSMELGELTRVEVFGDLDFTHTLLLDIVYSGGGPQQFTESFGVGGTTGFQQLSNVGGRSFYWIGNEGSFHNPSNWSFRSGGAPAHCLPDIIDTIVFDNSSFNGPDQRVLFDHAELSVKSIIAQNTLYTFSFYHDDTLIVTILQGLHLSNKGVFSTPTHIYTLDYASNVHISISLAGKHEIHRIHAIRSNLVTIFADSLEIPNCDFYMEGSQSRVLNVTGPSWVVGGFYVTNVETNLFLSHFNVGSISSKGNDNVFKAKQTDVHIMERGFFETNPVEIRSIRYFGTEELFVGFFEQLDTLIFDRAARFFTYNDTTGDTVVTRYVYMNFSSIPGKSYMRGLTALDATVVSDIEIARCDFGRLRLFNTRLFTLSGDIAINVELINTTFCGRTSLLTKHKDSMSSNFFIKSSRDSLYLDGFHIQGISTFGNGHFISRGGIDLGGNSGIEFRSSRGRKFYWVGGTGWYSQPINWSDRSGGAAGNCVPTARDTVIFDGMSFKNFSDTVWLPSEFLSFAGLWVVDSNITGQPVFMGTNARAEVYITRHLHIHKQVTWGSPVSFVYCTSNQQIAELKHPYPGKNLFISTPFCAGSAQLKLIDSFNAQQFIHGFGQLSTNGFPLVLSTYLADSATGFSSGFAFSKADFSQSTLYIDTITNHSSRASGNQYLRPCMNMTDSRLYTHFAELCYERIHQPRSIFFRDSVMGVLKLGMDRLLGGEVDSVIAYGGLTIDNISNFFPAGVTKIGILEVDGFFKGLSPVNGQSVYLNHDGYLRGLHEFQLLQLMKGKRYEIEPTSTIKYTRIDALGSICNPIEIVSSLSDGNSYFFEKMGQGVFNGQGVRLGDCFSVGSTSYTGIQAVDLGNNTRWVFGRDPSYGLPDFSSEMLLCKGDSFYVTLMTLYPGALSFEITLDGDSIQRDNFGFYLSKAGRYLLKVEFEPNCFLYDSTSVQVYGGERLSLGNDTVICEGEYVYIEPNIIDDETVYWSTGSRRPFLYVEKTGTYWVRVTGAGGCTFSDTIFVGVNRKPTQVAGPDTTVCGDEIYLTGRHVNQYQYLWNTGHTTSRLPVSNSGTYSVYMTNGICEVRDTVNIQVVAPLRFSLGSDTVLSIGEKWVIQPDTLLPSYSWNTGDTTPSIEVNKDGLYILTTRKEVCVTSDSVNIRFKSRPQVFFQPTDSLICQGDSVDIIPIIQGDIIRYEWNTGSIDSLLTGIHREGAYIVTVYDSFFSASDTFMLKVQPSFSFSLGKDTVLCNDATLSLQVPLPADSFQWSPSHQGIQKIVEWPGTYALTVFRGVCQASDTISVSYEPLIRPDTWTDTLVCENDTIDIRVNPGILSLRWSDGIEGGNRSFVNPGLYRLFYRGNVCVDSLSIFLQHRELPMFNLGNDTGFCENEGVYLTAFRPFALTYLWDDGVQTPDRYISKQGVYGVTLSDGVCSVYDDIQIVEEDLPVFVLGSDTSFCPGVEIVLEPSLFQDVQYLWHDGSTDRSFEIRDTGWVKLTVKGDYCQYTDSLYVLPCECDRIYIPTAFSPNGDGINDMFITTPCFTQSFRIQIYNRWGQKVFESNDIQQGWDGFANGIRCQQGVYMYKISMNVAQSGFKGIKPLVLQGTFTLLR